MLKGSGTYSTCYILRNHCYPLHSTSTSPSSLPQQRARPSAKTQKLLKPQNRRTYADVQDKSWPEFRDNLNWPKGSSSSRPPTPYEIFELDRGAAYTKHRFHHLVKLYHPDRHEYHQNTSGECLSRAERLERYRLVISAHEILSDPIKRQEYDRSGGSWSRGAGWSTDSRHRSGSRHTEGYYAPGSHRPYGTGEHHDRSPFGNATWEDWERWHVRNTRKSAKHKPSTKPLDSNTVAALVILTAVLTGIVQAAGTGQSPGSIEEKAQAFTQETSRFLKNRVEEHKTSQSDSDGRIDWFLEKRDPSKYGLKDQEGSIYQNRFLPPSPPKLEQPKKPDSDE
jgi:curved DNA-binding protein CbpA